MEDDAICLDMPAKGLIPLYKSSLTNGDSSVTSGNFDSTALNDKSNDNNHDLNETRCCSSTQKVKQLIIDANGSNWHQSPIFAVQDKERNSMENLPILDFDLLCATIAMQREPISSLDIQRDTCEVGVQRMWEGGVLDCLDNKEIALRTFCCPSITYGKNLRKAGFGSCMIKGGIHFLLLFGAFISYILFLCAYGHWFLYLAITLLICVAAYASYYRIQIRRRFNIKGSESDGLSSFDDSLNHFVCGCCTLCQEARTLEINNVQDGNWHGRGDTIWVGGYAMAKTSENPESTIFKQPVVVTMSTEKNLECDDHSSDEYQESCAPLMHHQ